MKGIESGIMVPTLPLNILVTFDISSVFSLLKINHGASYHFVELTVSQGLLHAYVNLISLFYGSPMIYYSNELFLQFI